MTSQEPMGFAGIARLASTLPPMPTFDPPAGGSAAPLSESAASGQPRPASPAKKAFWTKGRAWAAVAVVGFGLWGVINASQQQPRYTPSYNLPSGTTAQPPAYQAAPVPQSSAAASVVEAKPTIGTNLALSRSELRYCFAEKVRLGLMLDMIDNRISAHVRNVNALVDDYNARCGSYRYRESDRTAAQASVDRDTANLTSQARARIASWR